MPDKVFECARCGHCCEGRGGIVLSDKDIARLAAFLGIGQALFLADYTFLSNGKRKLGSGQDGFCVFFKKGAGCGVHAAKPDICRAWPFFRGNLEDAASLEMARSFCPGIKGDFARFTAEGIRYMLEAGLASPHAAALDVSHLFKRIK